MSQSKEDFEKVTSPTSSSQDESSQKDEATTSKKHAEPASQMEIEVEGPQRSENDKESPPTPKDETPTSSKENESKPSSSGCNKANGDSGSLLEKSGNSSDEDTNKCQKSSDDCNTSTQEDESETGTLSMFRKLKPKVKKRNYRSERNFGSDDTDSHNDTSNENWEIIRSGRIVRIRTNVLKRIHRERNTIDDDEDEYDEDVTIEDSDDESTDEDSINYGSSSSGSDDTISVGGFDRGTPENLNKEKPKPGWLVVPELVKREVGINPLFRRRFYGSLATVQRLEIMYIFEAFEGCVNALNFNQKGDLLASSSDDTSVVILNWAPGKKHSFFESGHRNNVFQTKWLLFDVQNLIATCARDGEVRLLDINHGVSRKIGVHYAPTHKLGLHIDTPDVITSVGEDARVLSIDVRDSAPTVLLVVQDGDYNVPLYSVHINPVKGNEFCVTGRSQTVRVYDRRKVSKPLYTLCPQHLYNNKRARVTCAVYNYNGTEILASYSDEAIYLFDAVNPDQGEFAHRYQGHRNTATVKGVNYFGPKSEYVISGSDCGSIYIWEKNTEAVVQWMRGDEHGVVNCLEPHPHIPILATSGLDADVKVWAPSYPLDTAVGPKNSDRRGSRYKKNIEFNVVGRHGIQMIRSFIRRSYGEPRLSSRAFL